MLYIWLYSIILPTYNSHVIQVQSLQHLNASIDSFGNESFYAMPMFNMLYYSCSYKIIILKASTQCIIEHIPLFVGPFLCDLVHILFDVRQQWATNKETYWSCILFWASLGVWVLYFNTMLWLPFQSCPLLHTSLSQLQCALSIVVFIDKTLKHKIVTTEFHVHWAKIFCSLFHSSYLTFKDDSIIYWYILCFYWIPFPSLGWPSSKRTTKVWSTKPQNAVLLDKKNRREVQNWVLNHVE